MKEQMAFTAALLISMLIGMWIENGEATHIVETFTADLTITIKCSGDCNFAAMIAEAREAAAK